MANNRGNVPAPKAPPPPKKLDVPVAVKPLSQAEAIAAAKARIVAKAPPPPPKVAPAQAKASDGVEVVALRPGVYKTSRKSVGDEFVISGLDKLGDWMALKDPKAEALRRDEIKKKKLAAK